MMSDYTMRGDAPLSDSEWEALDGVVVKTAKTLLVGRRFVELTGPLGAGTLAVPVFGVCAGEGECACDEGECECGCAEGECDCDAVHTTGPTLLSLWSIQQDFLLSWRAVEANRKMGMGLELGPAAAAAAAVAHQEDGLLFDVLLTAEGRNTVALMDWDEPGGPLENVVAATQALVSAGFYGPYAVVLSPALYAKTQRVSHGMGRIVGKLIADVAEGGVLRSPTLQPDEGLVLSLGAHNMDLVVGQDMTTAYLGNEGLDHRYRVMESLVLRIKRPGAICTFEKE
jgi:uncharacterized linocin/CFP29 family protein